MKKGMNSADISILTKDIVGFIREKDKLSIDEISRVFSLTKDEVFQIAGPLIEDNVLGIEYKFTTPYFYISDKNFDFKKLVKGVSSPEYDIQEIQGVLNELNKSIDNEDIERIADSFKKLIILLGSVTGARIVPKISEISRLNEHMNKKLGFYLSPDSLENEISLLIEKCKMYLEDGRFSEGKRVYDRAFELFSKIPSDYIQHKAAINAELVELYKELNVRHLKILNVKAIEVKGHIFELLKTGRNYLARDNFSGAFEIYKRCINTIPEMPQPFLKKRFEVYNEIFDFYKEAILKMDNKKGRNIS